MVEGEALGPLVRRPAGLGRVTAAVRLGGTGQQGGEGDGRDPHPGVAAGVAVGPQLLQVQPGHVRQAGLLGQLPAGRLLRGLLGQQEAAGQCPVARVRLLAALDEQHVQRARAEREDGQVHGHGEGFEGVLVVAAHEHPPP
ncbi:hypothetical protein SGLAM104S_04643 [Streptomyces glaucescens]